MGDLQDQKQSKIQMDQTSLGFAFATSLMIAILTLVASLGGLLNPDWLYPSEALRRFALANDLANLLIGLPILLTSMWLTHRRRLVGLLLWPGALMYAMYNYLAYVIAVPISWIYLSYLIIVSLSLYALLSVAVSIDGTFAQQHLSGKVPERLSGVVLIILGGFVFIRVLSVISSAIMDEASVPTTDLALLVADVLLAPAWIIVGVALWKKNKLGYIAGLGLLFQGSMLFIGLMLVLALQPIFTDSKLPLTDIIVVAFMGLICFIPFALFLRGVQIKGAQPPPLITNSENAVEHKEDSGCSGAEQSKE